MGIAILGPVTVDGTGTALSPRDRVVLCALAIRAGMPVSADELADALWGDDPPASAAKVLQGCIMRLRRTLGAAAIQTTNEGYALRLTADEIDARRFERLVGRARDLLVVGEPDRARSIASDALGLWRGRALEDLAEWAPGRVEAERLDDLRLDAEDLQVDAALRAGAFDEVLALAGARIAASPLRERRWWHLALAQYQAGRQGDALATLREARTTLVRELGVDPGPALAELEESILQQDPALSTPAAPPVDARSPYPGLVPLGPDDADAFFGRDGEIDECLRRLDRDGVVVIVGPSGSGKSSLVQAGIAPRLRDRGSVSILTPTPHPVAALAAAVRALPVGTSAHPATIVIDQCEEALTLCDDAEERSAFFAQVVEHAATRAVVIAMRADRMGDISAYPGLASLVESHLLLLTGMSDENLRRIIEEPARRAGLLLEPGLVDLLIRDVEGEPGSLPLLAHALRETWERREGRTLTVSGYQASGGIRTAIALTAERVFEAAPPDQQRMLRDLMLRLVRPSEDGEPSRARVVRRTVSADAAHEQLIETLVRARLVTSDDQTVEIAHEALVRAWPRLRGWLAEDVEGQRIRRHLTESADAWDALGRPDSELYRGVRLAQALDWHDREAASVTATEADFLAAAGESEAASLHRAEHEAVRQRRNNRRLLVAVAGVAVMAIAASTFGIAAAGQARRADAAADIARAQELAASAVGALRDDPSLAALLAVASAQVAPPDVRAAAALHEALGAVRESRPLQMLGDSGWLGADVSPDGSRMALASVEPGSSGKSVDVVDTVTGDIVWREELPARGEAASASTVRPLHTADGRELVWGVIWNPSASQRIGPDEPPDAPAPEGLPGIYVRSAVDGAPRARIDVGACGGYPVDVSATHVLVRTPASAMGTRAGPMTCRWNLPEFPTVLELVDRATGGRTVLTTDSGHVISRPGFSGDGRYATFEDAAAHEVRVVEVATGATVLARPGGFARDLSEDGSLMLMGILPLEVVDVETGEVVATLDPGEAHHVVFAAFAPGDASVFATSLDSMVRGWDTTSGKLWFEHRGSGVGSVSFTDDGRVGVAYPEWYVATVITPHRVPEAATVEGCPGSAVLDGTQITGGRLVFTTYCDGSDAPENTVLDVASGQHLGPLPTSAGGDARLSPDGARIVRMEAVGAAAQLVVRDVETGTIAVSLDRACETADGLGRFGDPACVTGDEPRSPDLPWRIRWSPDGSKIAAPHGEHLAVWDAASGRLLWTQNVAVDTWMSDFLFTPDSAKIIVPDGLAIMSVLDAASGTILRTRGLDGEGTHALGLIGFSPDGSQVIGIGPFRENPAASLYWIDVESLTNTRVRGVAHDGSAHAVAMSPDGSRFATAASDGVVRVWDAASAQLLHEIPYPEAVNGVAWMDDERLALAPAGGGVEVVTTDVDELLVMLRARLTRGFTLTECARYGFGAACPTLVDLGARPRPAEADRAIEGVYRVDWSEDDLRAAINAHFESTTGGSLSEASRDEIDVFLQPYTDGLILAFEDGEWVWTQPGADEPLGQGTYRIESGMLRLEIERGTLLTGVVLLEAGFAVDDDGLHLDADSFRGYWSDLVPFTARELERMPGSLSDLPLAPEE